MSMRKFTWYVAGVSIGVGSLRLFLDRPLSAIALYLFAIAVLLLADKEHWT